MEVTEAPRRRWRLVMLGLASALVLALAACGGDDNNDSSTQAATTGGASTSGASSDVVAEAKQKVEAFFAGENFKEPPAESPPPQTGKNVWQVSVGLALPASGQFADAVKDSAKTLGWTVTVYDAKFSPDRFQEGIRQAIADKADGIVLYNIDCNLARPAMEQANKAGIPLIGAESLDCSDSKPGDESLFDGELIYTYGDFPTWVNGLGAAQADWVIAHSEGKAKAIVFSQKDLQTGVLVDQGFRKEFAKCTTCEVARTVNFEATDLGPKLQEKTQQAILQTPDADYIVVPYDDLMTGGIAAAVNASGRKDKIQVIAGGGYANNLDLVRKNQGQNAGYITSIPWEGYAADTLNRVLAGEKAVNSGAGIGLFDKDHNVPASGAAPDPYDYAALYKKAWEAAKG
jgi:ribose transport system substrate-binding protein